MSGAHKSLRDATQAVHEALHGAEPFARIAEGRMDREGYGALLVMLHRYHTAMAGHCIVAAASLQAPVLGDAHRLRLAALKSDLAWCRQAAAREEEEPARHADFAVGCLYTVQGSTLGGKVIHRQLAALLPEGGRGFFAGHADDGAHWRLFCARLELHAPAMDMARVQAGAAHAFARFGGLLNAMQSTLAA